MKYRIMNSNRYDGIYTTIDANNGKNALKKYHNGMTSSGGYYFHKVDHTYYGNVWEMSTTYGFYVVAVPENIIEGGEKK